MAERNIKIVDLSDGKFYPSSKFLAVEDGDDVMIEGSDIGNKVCNSFAYTQDLQTTAKVPTAAINEIQPNFGKVLTEVLQAGSTSLTFTDNSITSSSWIDVNSVVNPISMEVSAGEVILTFGEQIEDITVKVVIT